MTGGSARAKELFLELLELSGAEREARLAGAEPELAEAARALLAAHADAGALERRLRTLEAARVAARRAPGQRLGAHELLEEVGSGAFGSVWRARQLALGRVVALKVLRAGYLADAAARARFHAEAAAVARLDHAHIVPVYEVGEHEGSAFFSMKWLEGGTLAERLARPWPAPAAARLMADVARAVHHAHQRGLLHRDLKPSNVLLDAEGHPHVADFGIAMRMDDDRAAADGGARAGTPAYMAPEQARGEELTVTTDVWALGCILYELLGGRAAFGGAELGEILRKVQGEEPAPLRALRPDLPRDLETIVYACLRKEPGHRYASANALADDLERWLAHEPIAAGRTGTLERLALFCRRAPLAASLIGLAAGLVVLLAVVATYASVELGSRLREAYLGEARATRLSGALGARTAALERLALAAVIRPGDDLRDEAIACLALTDLELERTIPRPPGLDELVVCDPTLTRLAVGDERGLHVLDFESGAKLVTLTPVHDFGLLRWSARGRWLFSKHDFPAGQPGTRLRVWDVQAGRELLGRDEAVAFRACDFALDEGRLAYGTAADELVVLALPEGTELVRRPLDVSVVAFDPAGARLALGSGGDEPRLELCDAASGRPLSSARLPDEPYDVAWVGDDALVVACGDFKSYVLDAATLATRAVCQGHSAEVVEVFVAGTGPLAATYSWDETTRLWDLRSGREIRRSPARVLGFASDGRHLALTDERSWSRWRLRHDELLRTLAVHRGKAPRDLDFAPDGRALATAGSDGVYLWDGRADSRPALVLAEESRAVRMLHGGRALVTSGPGGLWRIESESRAVTQLLDVPLWGLALSRDGHTLATQSREAVYLLDPDAPAAPRVLRAGDARAHLSLDYLALSADATRVAAGNWRGLGVYLWDLRQGDAPRVFLADQENVRSALSPDGELLATTTAPRLELWSTASGARLFAHERQRAFGNAPAPVVFSPDGKQLAFALTNEIVRMIDTETFALLATLEPPVLESMSELAFTPDGRTLGAACSTNRVQLWDLDGLERALASLGLAQR
jgi:eukaryotic-like serine/threonine-protein kinase